MNMAKHLGHGVGLRHQHFGRIAEPSAAADWFDVINENCMIRGDAIAHLGEGA
jgi:hypothetical protein